MPTPSLCERGFSFFQRRRNPVQRHARRRNGKDRPKPRVAILLHARAPINPAHNVAATQDIVILVVPVRRPRPVAFGFAERQRHQALPSSLSEFLLLPPELPPDALVQAVI